MSDHSKTNSENERREELTAYLDGELSAEVAAAVERRMASDERYRSELQQLSAVWNCLDELPQKTVDQRFTQTTLEMVVLSAEQDAERQQSWRRWLRPLLLAMIYLACALTGYALVDRWGQGSDRRIAKTTTRSQNQRRRDQWPERIAARLAEINRDISRADQEAIKRWASNYWREHRERIVAGSPHESQHRMPHWRGAPGGRELAQLRHLLDRSRGNSSPRLEAGQFRKLERRLSSRAQRQLSLASSEWERQQMLSHWIQQTIRAGMMQRMLDPQRNAVREQDLEPFFVEELSSENRQRLLNLPRDQMQQELRRLYMRDVLDMTSPRGGPESRRGAAGGPRHDRPPPGSPRYGRPPPRRN